MADENTKNEEPEVDPTDSPEIADAKKQASKQKQEQTLEDKVQELIASKKYYLPIKK